VAPIIRATKDGSDHILTEGLISTVDLDIEQISLRLEAAEAIEVLERMTSPKGS
jgi:hypothetical protein